MKALRLHRWNVTPKQAVQIQQQLRDRVEREDRLSTVRHVAGADIALDLKRKVAVAGVIVYKFPEMSEIERIWARAPITFPYVPGLLSFREIPALLRAFAKLRHTPDVIFVDGHGLAHPRRTGIASHLGLVLNCPTIGCAKSILVGECAAEPADRAEATSDLIHKGEVIAKAMRTKPGVSPIYISVGHRVSLDTAVRLTLAVADGFRVPRPTRDADRYVAKVKAARLPNLGRKKQQF